MGQKRKEKSTRLEDNNDKKMWYIAFVWRGRLLYRLGVCSPKELVPEGSNEGCRDLSVFVKCHLPNARSGFYVRLSI